MPLYEVTPLAGPRIADKRHDGPGSVVTLTESQAKHELIIGTIKDYVAPKTKQAKR